jgi:hypothetical protein
MKNLFFLFVFLGSCSRPLETIHENDDYVLVEFAARLEEEQEKFQRIHGPSKPTVP